MMVDISLFTVGLAASVIAAALIWRKVPLLLQVPPQLVEESFVTRPSRVKRAADQIIEFFRSGEYKSVYYLGALAFLKFMRLSLLRFERFIFRLTESLENDSREWSRKRQQYWSALKQQKFERHDGNGGT